MATVVAHLAPGHRFAFDTRKQALGEWREWTPAAARRRLDDSRHGGVKA